MCESMISIRNPRYRNLSSIEGSRFPDFYLRVPCGKCASCRKRRASDWRVRLIKEYELGHHRTVYFVTLTFDEPSHARFIDTDSPEKSIRLFLERYRAATGKSLRHWFVVEYGERRGRFHIHGLIFNPLVSYNRLKSLWSYGFSYIERLRGASGCSYVVKYITKSQAHIGKYSGRVFTSPGFGKCYLTTESFRLHRHQFDSRPFVDVTHFNCATYIYINNYKFSLPRYYRKHIFTDSERLQITRAWCRFYQSLAYTPLEIERLKSKLKLNVFCSRPAPVTKSALECISYFNIERFNVTWGSLSGEFY